MQLMSSRLAFEDFSVPAATRSSKARSDETRLRSLETRGEMIRKMWQKPEGENHSRSSQVDFSTKEPRERFGLVALDIRDRGWKELARGLDELNDSESPGGLID
jgi:hypothetical protein